MEETARSDETIATTLSSISLVILFFYLQIPLDVVQKNNFLVVIFPLIMIAIYLYSLTCVYRFLHFAEIKKTARSLFRVRSLVIIFLNSYSVFTALINEVSLGKDFGIGNFLLFNLILKQYWLFLVVVPTAVINTAWINARTEENENRDTYRFIWFFLIFMVAFVSFTLPRSLAPRWFFLPPSFVSKM